MARTTTVSLVVSTKTSLIFEGAGSSLSKVIIGLRVLLSAVSLIPHYQMALSTSMPIRVPPFSFTSLYRELGMDTLFDKDCSMD